MSCGPDSCRTSTKGAPTPSSGIFVSVNPTGIRTAIFGDGLNLESGRRSQAKHSAQAELHRESTRIIKLSWQQEGQSKVQSLREDDVRIRTAHHFSCRCGTARATSAATRTRGRERTDRKEYVNAADACVWIGRNEELKSPTAKNGDDGGEDDGCDTVIVMYEI